MIVEKIDNGWGTQWPVKQLEGEILAQYLLPVIVDRSSTVLVNSTWYQSDSHQETLNYIKTLAPSRIVLVAMLDAPIPQPDWFNSVCNHVDGVGYYPGSGHIDFWALLANKHLVPPTDVTADYIDTAYMCLNRKPHWHRRQLYQRLTTMNLLDQGLVSMGIDGDTPARIIPNDNNAECDIAPHIGRDQYGISNDIVSIGNLHNWRRCFINIVTETEFDINRTYFVSEKIYKPIIGQKPFLVHAADGAHAWLTDRGFLPYTADFTEITDLDLCVANNIPEFLSALCKQPKSYWQHKTVQLQEKITYNKQQFLKYVHQQTQHILNGI
jgi:hypothetical protein